jgi:hypothetical protein
MKQVSMLVVALMVLAAVPASAGQTRYYDSRGRSLGTSSTSHGVTTFYNARGSVTHKAYRR